MTERQQNLRKWKARGLCLSCGAKRGDPRKTGGYCTRCCDILVARYKARVAKWR